MLSCMKFVFQSEEFDLACNILVAVGIHWHLWVKTSDDSLSGTDSRVFVCLYGAKGKTDEVELENKGDAFEQGNTDEFDVHVSDIGKPYKLRVFHDDSNIMSGWKLDQVINVLKIYYKFLYLGVSFFSFEISLFMFLQTEILNKTFEYAIIL